MKRHSIATTTWSPWTLRAVGIGLAMEAIAREERAERAVSRPRSVAASRLGRRGSSGREGHESVELARPRERSMSRALVGTVEGQCF